MLSTGLHPLSPPLRSSPGLNFNPHPIPGLSIPHGSGVHTSVASVLGAWEKFHEKVTVTVSLGLLSSSSSSCSLQLRTQRSSERLYLAPHYTDSTEQGQDLNQAIRLQKLCSYLLPSSPAHVATVLDRQAHKDKTANSASIPWVSTSNLVPF